MGVLLARVVIVGPVLVGAGVLESSTTPVGRPSRRHQVTPATWDVWARSRSAWVWVRQLPRCRQLRSQIPPARLVRQARRVQHQVVFRREQARRRRLILGPHRRVRSRLRRVPPPGRKTHHRPVQTLTLQTLTLQRLTHQTLTFRRLTLLRLMAWTLTPLRLTLRTLAVQALVPQAPTLQAPVPQASTPQTLVPQVLTCPI